MIPWLGSENRALCERLRERAGKYDEYDWHRAIELEAAEEIERLHAQLSEGVVGGGVLGDLRRAVLRNAELEGQLAYAASKNEEEIAADRAMTRASALEDAAAVCDAEAANPSTLWEEPGCWTHAAENCASAIRTMRKISPKDTP